jgi:Tol biopolymer transport system component
VLITGLLGVIATVAVWNLKPSVPVVVTRFALVLPEGQQFGGVTRQMLAISPDGTRLAYVAGAPAQLFLRSMGEMEARPITGRFAAISNPVFSPDSQWIIFWSDDTLKKIAITGGTAITICKAAPPYGINWFGDQVVFAQPDGRILRVSANGGEPELLAGAKPNETIHGPQILDDGRALLFTVATETGVDRWDKAQTVVQSLRSGARKVVLRGGSDARYLPTGHLIYAVGGTVLAVRFDLKKLEVLGGPVPILEGVRRPLNPAGNDGAAQIAFSATGSLVYIPGTTDAATSQQTLALVDRNGKVQSLGLPPMSYQQPAISPDGKQLAFFTDDGKEANIWVYDLRRVAPPRRLTFGGSNVFPIWSRDSKRIVFSSDREGDHGLFWQPADGSGTAERLTKAEQGTSHKPESWTRDGKLSFAIDRGTNSSIWTLSLNGDRKPARSLELPNSSLFVHSFSPDGRWVTYFSQELGGDQVFVQPFPPTGEKHLIPTDGPARIPLWSPDGKQIFYQENRTNRLFAVDVRTQPGVTFGKPVALPVSVVAIARQRTYDVTPDGKYFVALIPASGSQADPTRRTPSQINVVLNWFTELQQRVPVK